MIPMLLLCMFFFWQKQFDLPHCFYRMFTRMGQLEKAQGKRLNVDFLYTHPTSENRVKVLSGRSWLSFFP